MLSTEEENSTVVRLVQLLNALFSMQVTVLGISTAVRLMQPLREASLMRVMPSGSLMAVRLEQVQYSLLIDYQYFAV